MGLLSWLWKGLKGLGGLFLPWFVKVRHRPGLGSQVRWALRVIVLAVVLVGLGYINYLLDLQKVLRAPLPLLGRIWLPLLFLLIYILFLLGWWLWKLLGPEPIVSEFPDLDTAWDEAMRALDQSGIDVTEAPLFLVLGRPRETGESLFNAAILPWKIRNEPRRADAPLHVYAERDGIYVTCAGASLLGRQAILLGQRSSDGPDGAERIPARPSEAQPGQSEPVVPPSPARDWLPDSAEAGALAAGLGLPLAAECPPVSVLTPAARRSTPENQASGPRPRLLKDAEEIEQLTARLRHLCRRIVKERRPYCPVNGILLLIPIAATDTDSDASHVGSLCRRDLSAAREVLRVHCPVYALACDLETVPGFLEFLKFFPDGPRQRYLGQPFPLVPDVEAASVPALIDEGLRWMGRVLFPGLIYRLWRLEVPGKETVSEAIGTNVRLYQLLSQMRERPERLARILIRGVVQDARGAPLLGGCFLAATGREPASEQAFVAGVFRQMFENQNAVSWTAEALAEETSYRRWTAFAYAGIFIYLVVLLGLILTVWTR